jgi:signal transduction histidine kinase
MSIQSEFKGLEFSFIVDKNVPKCLVGDAKRINQVLFSLLGNAIKYTTEGHIKVFIERIISSNSEDNHIEVPEHL